MKALHAADPSVDEAGWIVEIKNYFIGLCYFHINHKCSRLKVRFFLYFKGQFNIYTLYFFRYEQTLRHSDHACLPSSILLQSMMHTSKKQRSF